MKTLCDTNVFSRIFAGDHGIRNIVETSEAAIDATIFIECIQGSKSNTEKTMIRNYLSNFPLLMITPEISAIAIGLIDRYSNSFGLALPDALIAASAIENDLVLLTFNTADFRFIDNLKCSEPG